MANGVNSIILDGMCLLPPDTQAFQYPPLDIYPRTLFLFFLCFFMASQDIAVDGWAHAMLFRDRVGYASIINVIGQSYGVAVLVYGLVGVEGDDGLVQRGAGYGAADRCHHQLAVQCTSCACC